MPIQVTCSHCGKTYQLPEARAGQTGKCQCGHLIRVPEAPESTRPDVPPPPAAPPPGPVLEDEVPEAGEVRCPSCGMVARQARVCEWCNATLVPDMPPPPLSRMSDTEAGLAEGASIQYVTPLSFIKNAAVLSFAYVTATNGLGYVVNLAGSGGSLSIAPIILSSGSLLGVVIGTVFAILSACLTVVIFNWVAGRGNGFPLRFRELAPWTSGTGELKRVGPVSAMVTGALGGLIYGFLLGVCFLLVMATFSGRMRGVTGAQGAAVAGVMLLGMPLALGVWTGIVSLALSPLYNLLAAQWGGVQFQSVAVEAPGREHHPPILPGRRPRCGASAPGRPG